MSFFFFVRGSHNKENIIWGSIFWVPYVGILPIPRRVHVPDNGNLGNPRAGFEKVYDH